MFSYLTRLPLLILYHSRPHESTKQWNGKMGDFSYWLNPWFLRVCAFLERMSVLSLLKYKMRTYRVVQKYLQGTKWPIMVLKKPTHWGRFGTFLSAATLYQDWLWWFSCIKVDTKKHVQICSYFFTKSSHNSKIICFSWFAT